MFHVPAGVLSSVDDQAARQRRLELREKLKSGNLVVLGDGNVKTQAEKRANETAIVVPAGKLAAGFYWYDRDRELFMAEVAAMNKFFPQFSREILPDGRMAWVGLLQPSDVRPNAQWLLQVVYDHDHPKANFHGGSVRVYSIDPDLKEMVAELGHIPHLLIDGDQNLHLCTVTQDSFKAGTHESSTAASALAWAAKWICAFELWLAGDLPTEEFQDHLI